MNGKARLGLLVGLVGCGLLGWSLYTMFTSGSCVQIGPGEYGCGGPGALGAGAGVLLTVISMFLGAGIVAFAGLFLAIGLSALIPTWQGQMPGMETFGWTFGGIFALCGLAPFALMLFGGRMLARKQAQAEELYQRGTRAIGTVVEVRDTGMTINDNPRVDIRMRVAPLDGSPPVERHKRITAPRVAIPRAGERYPVWFDRNDAEKWMFATAMDETASAEVKELFARCRSAGEAAAEDEAADGPVEELEALTRLWKDGALTDCEFADAKARLLPRIGR